MTDSDLDLLVDAICAKHYFDSERQEYVAKTVAQELAKVCEISVYPSTTARIDDVMRLEIAVLNLEEEVRKLRETMQENDANIIDNQVCE